MKTKEQMIEYITTNTEKYPQQNSWNNLWGFSKNVKIRNLPITHNEREQAYNMLSTDDFYFYMNECIKDWELSNPDLKADFNGRMGGHLVLYKNGKTLGSQEYYYDESELKEMNKEYIINIYKDVKSFIGLYNELIKTLKWLCKNFKVKEESYTLVKTHNVLKEVC